MDVFSSSTCEQTALNQIKLHTRVPPLVPDQDSIFETVNLHPSVLSRPSDRHYAIYPPWRRQVALGRKKPRPRFFQFRSNRGDDPERSIVDSISVRFACQKARAIWNFDRGQRFAGAWQKIASAVNQTSGTKRRMSSEIHPEDVVPCRHPNSPSILKGEQETRTRIDDRRYAVQVLRCR